MVEHTPEDSREETPFKPKLTKNLQPLTKREKWQKKLSDWTSRPELNGIFGKPYVDVNIKREKDKNKLDEKIQNNLKFYKWKPFKEEIKGLDLELEIKILQAVKKVWLDMTGDDDLIFEDDIKNYPDKKFVLIPFISKVEGMVITNDEEFVSRIACEVAMPPDDSEFKKTLWKVFSKKVALLHTEI
jgi:hypothetical protein